MESDVDYNPYTGLWKKLAYHLRIFLARLDRTLYPSWSGRPAPCIHPVSTMRHFAFLVVLLARVASCLHAPAMPLLKPRRAAAPLMAQSSLSKLLLGDRSQAPVRQAIKEQLRRSSAGIVPEDLADLALDQAFGLLEAYTPGGLEKLLLEPGELQKKREPLRRDLSKRLAATIETPLGDELEERLGMMILDAVIDDALARADFLASPSKRLAELERKLSLVKAEMGVFRLGWYRLRQLAASRAGKFVLLSAVSAVALSAVLLLGPSTPRISALRRLAWEFVAWLGPQVDALREGAAACIGWLTLKARPAHV